MLNMKIDKCDLGLIVGIIGIIIGGSIAFYIDHNSSNKISILENQNLNLENELIKVKNEINNFSLSNKNEILLAIYEAESFGLDNQSKEKFFQTKFGFSFEQAQNILNYLSKTDDYDLAFSSLMHNDYSTSLYHFDMALIKDPTNKEVKVGKSISLNGLRRTNEAREILFEVDNEYEDKKFINKLIGDSYCIEENYSKCAEYYINSVGYFFTEQGKKDIQGLQVLTDTCEIEATGKFDSPWISINNQSDGWKICEVIVEDLGIVIDTRYKVNYN